jgi:hypothetical protein
MEKRVAYLLSTNPDSERTQFSKKVLENIGFDVIIFIAFLHHNKLMSHKLSMMSIYNKIVLGNDEFTYVFEDDINVLEPVTLSEIIEYEKLCTTFLYLGICKIHAYDDRDTYDSKYKINDKIVKIITGNVRGLHAVGMSKDGAKELAKACLETSELYIDVILESLMSTYPTHIMRYDLESTCKGHRGIIYQDRVRFPTSI